jgi:hypothetical protein
MSGYRNEHCKKRGAPVLQEMCLFTNTLHALTPTEQSDHTAAVKASYLAEGFIYGIKFLPPPMKSQVRKHGAFGTKK